jgi:hypothetical protein
VRAPLAHVRVHNAPDAQSLLSAFKVTEQDRKALNDGGPWGAVIELTGSLLGAPSVFELAREFVDTEEHSNLKAVAWLIRTDLPGYELLRPFFQGIYQHRCTVEFFESEELAVAWLHSQVSTCEASATNSGSFIRRA